MGQLSNTRTGKISRTNLTMSKILKYILSGIYFGMKKDRVMAFVETQRLQEGKVAKELYMIT